MASWDNSHFDNYAEMYQKILNDYESQDGKPTNYIPNEKPCQYCLGRPISTGTSIVQLLFIIAGVALMIYSMRWMGEYNDESLRNYLIGSGIGLALIVASFFLGRKFKKK